MRKNSAFLTGSFVIIVMLALLAAGIYIGAPSMDGTYTSPIWLAIGVSALAILCIAGAALALAVQRRKVKLARLESAQRLALLNTARDAFIAWDKQDKFICSTRLARWLDTDVPLSRYRMLAAEGDRPGFLPDDFLRLSRAINRLREHKEPFPDTLTLSLGQRIVEASGELTLVADKKHETCIIWFRDVTDIRNIFLKRTGEINDAAASYNKLASTIDAMAVPVWRLDEDLKIIWTNNAYARAVEAANTKTVIDRQIRLVSTPAGDNIQKLKPLLQKDAGPLTEKNYVVIDGQRKAVEISYIPCPGDRPEIVAYALDVTAVEETRTELLQYNESQAETLNKLSTAVAIFASDKTLEFYNSAFAQLWTLPEDWLSGNPHHSEVLEVMREKRRLPEQADFPAWKRQHLALYTSLMEAREEMWYLPDASTLRVVTQPRPMGGLLIFFEDVTDRLALERSYNTLFAVQKATLNNLHEAVAVFGSDGLLKLYNPAFREIWRLFPDFLSSGPHMTEIIEQCMHLLEEDHDHDVFGVGLVSDDSNRVIRSGRLRRTDDSIIDYTIVPLPDGATLLSYLDATDSIRIERALRERNEALETADRLKTEFIAHVSYELRSPLNSITGFAELLDHEYYGPLNSQQHNYTRNILESSSQLMLLINDLIDLSVIEAGRMQLDLANIDTAKIIRTTAALIQEDARSRNLQVEIDLPEQLAPFQGDEKRIRQILYNLASNALKYTPPKGTITFGATATGKDINLFVKDTGLGIPKEEQTDVFETFRTGKDVPKGQGVGLGLSLVRRFTELHGGRVTLQSEPGKGTKVTCTIPRKKETRARAPRTKRRKAAQAQ